MHIVVRWLMRNVILLFSEEWVNAHREVRAMQAAYQIGVLCDAELRIFKAALADLEHMQIEAQQVIARFPGNQEVVEVMLQERMQHLAHRVHEEASEAPVAAQYSAR
jgi:hypothetical protein